MLQQESFDLVITDEQMPIRSGHELVALMRGCRRCEHVPVIMLTAKQFELDVMKLQHELRVSAILGKPPSPRELVKIVAAELAACLDTRSA